MIEVTVPNVGESITEVQIGQWLKAEGDWINQGEDIVEIETEKASVQIPASTSGYLRNILKQEEEFAVVGETIASIEAGDNGQPAATAKQSGGAPQGSAATDQTPTATSAPSSVPPAATSAPAGDAA